MQELIDEDYRLTDSKRRRGKLVEMDGKKRVKHGQMSRDKSLRKTWKITKSGTSRQG